MVQHFCSARIRGGFQKGVWEARRGLFFLGKWELGVKKEEGPGTDWKEKLPSKSLGVMENQ